MRTQPEEEAEKMSESLTANPVTPYTEISSSAASAPARRNTSNESFDDHPEADRSESYSTDGSQDVDDDEEEDSELSLEELLYSVSSFYAIARPVSITMILAALAAVFINDDWTKAAGEQQFAEAYNTWAIDNSGDSSAWKNLAASIGNTLVMVTFIATMTFGIVLLYKYRCMKFLIGYMVLSSAMLLGILGDYMGNIAIEIYRIPIDVISYYVFMYNFAIVGITAIFYQKGIPSTITQMYLVITSVILAWHLSHFDDWTAWTMLGESLFFECIATNQMNDVNPIFTQLRNHSHARIL